MMRVDAEIKALVERLIVDSALFIDHDELEAWLDCFEEKSRYVVMPRNNRELGLPIGLMHCDTKDRIKDRIVCLRHANKFNPHYDRHILGASRINSVADEITSVETNFMIVQTNKSGESKLFCAGCYEDRIRVEAGRARFVERIALLDTFSIPSMLATPV